MLISINKYVEEEIQYKAFKFRLLPTAEQSVLLTKHFGCVRFIYNHFLQEKQEHYLKNGKTLNFNNCCSALTQLKQQEDLKWLSEVNSQSLIGSLMHLETAYGNFFKKLTKFPKYKKKGNHESFHCCQHVKVKNNLVQLVKFKEGIKFSKHREISGKIKSATISKAPSGKYFVSFLCEVPKHIPLTKTGRSIGIDLGLKDFLITSEGQRFTNPKFYTSNQKVLTRAQKHFSRKQKGSKRYEKQRIKVARIHEKIANSRNDMQHKVSLNLIKAYDLIALEDLNVKGMVKNHKLAKAIQDVSWSSFIAKLEYKANWYGKEVYQNDRFFPSSKTCSCCGHIKESLSLDERSWTCAKCNTKHDRDVNAARNLLQRALTVKSSGTDDYRHGAEVSPEEIPAVSKGVSIEVPKKKNERKYILKPHKR